MRGKSEREERERRRRSKRDKDRTEEREIEEKEERVCSVDFREYFMDKLKNSSPKQMISISISD